MALHVHAISVFDRCKKKNCTSKASLSASKSDSRQVTGLTILISPIDCCVRINDEPDLTVYLAL